MKSLAISLVIGLDFELAFFVQVEISSVFTDNIYTTVKHFNVGLPELGLLNISH
jgi:hypothetical protein